MSLSIKWVGSIHKTKGRNGFRPEAVVIHIMEGSLAGTDSWFNKPQSKVSAHYGIGKNGEIHQYVGESDTAWHAGRRSNPTWSLIKNGVNPNFYTVGIEHEGFSDTPWTDAMYRASASLVSDICNRWAITIDRDHIIGHREIYGVKTCPGNVVNLDKLVKMARGEAVSAETYNFIKKAGKVKTRADLNLRKGAPTTMAAVVKKLAEGTEVDYVGWTSNGQNVNGNAHWYKDSKDNYFWAGGTEKPVPGL